jgi:hypothetical protein
MSGQQVRDRQPEAFDCLVERLERRPGVDKDRGPALTVRDQVSIR